MASGIGNLPLEVLENIFEYLSAADKLVASLVCKRWLLACCSSKLLCNIIVEVTDVDNFLLIFQDSVRPFCNFIFKEVKIEEKCFSYLKSISERLLFLCFQVCEFESVISCDLKSFSQLKELFFDNCDLPEWKCVGDGTTLPNLTRFGYCTSATMSDALFLKVTNALPKLVTLSVAFCQISYNEAACRRFYPSGFNPDSALDTLFSYHSIETLVKNRAEIIKGLNFDNTFLSPSFLINVLKTKDLDLKCLSVAACTECIRSFKEIPSYQKNLCILNFSYLYSLTDDVLIQVCDNLHSLQDLNINYCHNITSESLKHIFLMKNLKKLGMINCIRVTEDGFVTAVQGIKCSLEKLDLTRSNAGDEFVYDLARTQKKLVILNLSYSSITSASLQYIAKYLINLQHLTLSYCKNITVFYDDSSLSNLKRLRELCLHGCSDVNEDIVRTIKGVELEYLNLSCISVTDAVIKAVGKHNPSIQDLALKNCSLLTDEAVDYIAKYFSRLKYLELFGCKNLTNRSVHTLTKMKSLKTLGLVHCANITLDAIQDLDSLNRKLSIQYYQACI